MDYSRPRSPTTYLGGGTRLELGVPRTTMNAQRCAAQTTIDVVWDSHLYTLMPLVGTGGSDGDDWRRGSRLHLCLERGRRFRGAPWSRRGLGDDHRDHDQGSAG